MKRFFPILIFFSFSLKQNIAQTQKLIVPKLSNVTVNEAGNILLPAYCVDATRVWPEYGNILTNVYYGSENTIITLVANKILSTLSLKKAIEKDYVKLVSEQHSITVKPSHSYIKIKKLNTEGLAAGEQKENYLLDESISGDLPSNKNSEDEDWEDHQNAIHKTITAKEFRDPSTKSKRIKEFTDNWIKKDGRNIRSEYWNVTDENDVIKIHERKVSDPNDNNPFNEMYEFLKEGELEDMSYCVNINPNDSSLSLSIKGKLKGAIPLEIEFDSKNKFAVKGEIDKEQLKSGSKNISALISISHEFKPAEEDSDYCRFNISTRICYPAEESSIDVEACGKTISLSHEEIEFEF